MRGFCCCFMKVHGSFLKFRGAFRGIRGTIPRFARWGYSPSVSSAASSPTISSYFFVHRHRLVRGISIRFRIWPLFRPMCRRQKKRAWSDFVCGYCWYAAFAKSGYSVFTADSSLSQSAPRRRPSLPSPLPLQSPGMPTCSVAAQAVRSAVSSFPTPFSACIPLPASSLCRP